MLHQLLGDGGSPAQAFPSCHQGFERNDSHAAGIIAFVGVEILVLRRDKRRLDQIRNIRRAHKEATLAREFIDDLAVSGIDAADGGRGILGKGRVVGQIAPINVKHRTNHEGPQRNPHDQRGEESAEK